MGHPCILYHHSERRNHHPGGGQPGQGHRGDPGPGGPGGPGRPDPLRHLAESWSAVPAGAALRRPGAHRLLRPQLGAGLPGTADAQLSAHRRGGSGGVLRHQPVFGPAVPEAGGTGLDPAAAVCGRRLPRAEDPSHGDSGQHRNHGRPPGRHSGLPAQVAGLHPGGGPADEGAGGGHALSGQARRGGAAQGLPHSQFQRPGHRVRAALRVGGLRAAGGAEQPHPARPLPLRRAGQFRAAGDDPAGQRGQVRRGTGPGGRSPLPPAGEGGPLRAEHRRAHPPGAPGAPV